jgi:hypothetical protein
MSARTEVDEHAATELQMYADNDSRLYHSSFIPIVKNLANKAAKGEYDSARAVDAFMYLADAAAKKYVAEFGSRGDRIDSVFNHATRRAVAAEWAKTFEHEYQAGNWDKHLTATARQAREARQSSVATRGRFKR